MERSDYIEIILDKLIELRRQEANIIEQMERSLYIGENDYINEELNIVIHERQLLEDILDEIKKFKEN